MAILPNSTTSVVRYAAGLYGLKLGNATLQQVQKDLGANPLVSLPAVLNAYYEPFDGKTSAQVAAIVVANAGIVAGQYGLTATNVADAVAIVTTALNSAAPLGNQGVAISNVLAGWSNDSPSDPVYGAAATAWNLKIAQSTSYANAVGTSDTAFGAVVTEFRLSAGGENRTGTEGDDTFIAVQGTFDNADRINGGAGFDTLKAQVSTAANGVVAPNVSNVEHLQFQAQHRSSDSGDNNLVGDSSVKVDFNTNVTNVTGFTTIENNNSRADLIVEDVRIASGQITKDITIAMRDTDPGNVDYGVYFDQNSLRNQSASTSTIRLQVMDTKSVVDGTAPLLNSPYGGFKFTATDSKGVAQVVTLQSAAIDNAQTYAELRTAFQAAADVAFGVGVVTVSLGAAFTVTDTTTGAQVSGTEINLSASGSFTFTTPTGSGWIANGVVPANSGLHTNFNTGGVTNTDLVTSKIVLDNVGRGSNGGDLVVGGLSVGTTSTSKGVQQFDITVEDNSKLQTISSTNNALQVVKIVNGTTNEQSDAYITTVQNKGNLTVNGTVANGDNALPGATSGASAKGFTDVRVIDASAMTGKLAFTAEFTEKAVAKYVNLVDTDGNPAADTVAVVYTGGSNNDTMVVNLDGKAVASNSNINVGREDFTFAFNGGAGDDSIDVAIDRGAANLSGAAQNWYNNQVINKNLTINGGDGNDTIRKPGAGNAVINGDGGNDVIYADNTGVQSVAALNATGAAATFDRKATWVFNTAVQAADDDVAQNLYDLKSAASKTVGSYGTKVTVDYRGLTAQVAVADTADYKLSDLEVNQAIKKAINGDAVLNKLLVAEDGPAGTLVITALTDGVHSNTSLAVTFNTLASTDLNATILSAYNAANGTALADTTALATAIATNVNDGAIGLKLQYVTQTADSTAGVEIVGAASVTTSDNKITGGAGDDVIVLGTTVGGDATSAIDDSNDTVVFSGSFGNDVVLNFVANAANAGKDVLDFKAFLGSANTTVTALLADANAAAANTDSLITLGTLDITGVALTGVRNDSAAEIAKLYTDDATANKGLYITVNTATNVGTVYQVVDGTAASDLTVTLMGSVDLADTAWGTLVAINFA